MKGFALGLGLKKRLRATRKWAIASGRKRIKNSVCVYQNSIGAQANVFDSHFI